MTINIQVGEDEQLQQPMPAPLPPKKKEPQASVNLNIRKMIDGTLVIFDHPDIDIAILPLAYKIVTFPKDEMGDHIYATQSRLFDFLRKKGVISLGSVQGGNVYGALEANIPTTTFDESIEPIQIIIYVIAKFVEEEKPFYNIEKWQEEEFERSLVNPDEEESTELGEIPHQPRKGVIGRFPGSNVAYGLTGMYRA